MLSACGGSILLPGDDKAQNTDTSEEEGLGYDDGTQTCTGSDLVPLAVIRTARGSTPRSWGSSSPPSGAS